MTPGPTPKLVGSDAGLTHQPTLPQPALSRPWLITILLVVANVAGWLVQIGNGVDPIAPDPDQLVYLGGNVALLTFTGELWRLAASIFLHAGLVHLLMNTYMLVIMGPYVERCFGRSGMLAIYLLGGLCASIASGMWSGATLLNAARTTFVPAFAAFAPHTVELIVSVGASGAIMALCGALAISVFSPVSEDGGNAPSLNTLLQVIGINLASGFFITGIDQAAHVGGVVAGFLLGAMIGQTRGTTPTRHLLRVASACLFALGFVALLLKMSDWSRLERLKEELNYSSPQEKIRQARAKAEEQARIARIEAEERSTLPEPVLPMLARGRIVKVAGTGTALAISSDESTAYVVSREENQLFIVDIASGEVRQRIATTGGSAGEQGDCVGDACKAQGVSGVAVLEQRRIALLPSLRPHSLGVINLDTGEVERFVPLGSAPRAIVVAPDQRRVYVQNANDNTISVIDTESWSEQTRLSLGDGTSGSGSDREPGLWLDASGGKLFAVDQSRRSIAVFDTGTLQQERRVQNEGGRFQVASLGGGILKDSVIWGFSDFRLYRIPSTLEEIERGLGFCRDIVPTLAAHHETGKGSLIAVHDQGYRGIHVMTNGAGIVVVANPDTGVSHGAYPVPGPVAQLQFSSNGRKLYALTKDGSLSIIDREKRLDVYGRELLCRQENR